MCIDLLLCILPISSYFYLFSIILFVVIICLFCFHFMMLLCWCLLSLFFLFYWFLIISVISYCLWLFRRFNFKYVYLVLVILRLFYFSLCHNTYITFSFLFTRPARCARCSPWPGRRSPGHQAAAVPRPWYLSRPRRMRSNPWRRVESKKRVALASATPLSSKNLRKGCRYTYTHTWTEWVYTSIYTHTSTEWGGFPLNDTCCLKTHLGSWILLILNTTSGCRTYALCSVTDCCPCVVADLLCYINIHKVQFAIVLYSTLYIYVYVWNRVNLGTGLGW